MEGGVNIVGLDLSLTAIGVARSDGPGVVTYQIPSPATELDRVRRLKYLGTQVDRICRGADVVIIEGHSFNSKNTHAHSLGELHGVVKVTLYQRGITYIAIPPKSLKKYATNDGNAGKDKMLAAAIRAGFEGDNNNAADAYWLRHMGLAHYLNNDVIAPRYREVVCRAIRWPVVEERKERVG
jgi:Holliday junction resolvasome RuvABC endonuclease subunit